MNYLGHAVLSFGHSGILTGNMIGDHVKGRLALEHFPADVKRGILLHRKIDAYADNHPATQRAKIWLRPDYGLYAGALMDAIYDHFLANDPKQFASAGELLMFSENVYRELEKNSTSLPKSFAAYFPHMRQHNWLYGYRTLQGVRRALAGVERRAKYMPSTEKAYEIFVVYYHELAQCYYELFDEMVAFVKLELSEQ